MNLDESIKLLIKEKLEEKFSEKVSSIVDETISDMGFVIKEAKCMKEDDEDDLKCNCDDDDHDDKKHDDHDDDDDDEDEDEDDDDELDESYHLNDASDYRKNVLKRTQYPKHPILPKGKAEKFAKAMISKMKVYLKKEKEFPMDKLDEFEKELAEKLREFGSIPVIPTKLTLVTPGDPMSDIMPEYSVSYKTLDQFDDLPFKIAVAQKILPETYFDDVYNIVEELAKEFNFTDKKMISSIAHSTSMVITMMNILDSDSELMSYIGELFVGNTPADEEKKFVSELRKRMLKYLKV